MAKTLDYNFAVDKSLVADTGPTLTCTRSGDATYFDASGVLQTAGTDTARFDHDPSDSNASLGLLIEEARTNLCAYSEGIGGTGWINTAIEVDAANATTAPDGTTTADEIGDNGTGSAGHYTRKSPAFGSAVAATCSVYAKAAKTNYLLIYVSSSASGRFFDLSDGTMGDTIGTLDGSGIEDVGNGWYRCWITDTMAGTWFPEIYVADGKLTGEHVYNGDNLHSIYLWGCQCENGSFPTSYIPTTTASVTRALDVVKNTSISIDRTTGYTMYVDFTLHEIPQASNFHLLVLAPAGGSYTESSFFLTTGILLQQYVGATANVTIQGIDSPAIGTRYRFAAGLDTNDSALFVDGAQRGSTDTNCALSTTLAEEIYVGSNAAATSDGNVTINRLAIFNTRLTDAELEDLSNGTFPVAASAAAAAGLGLTFGKIGMR